MNHALRSSVRTALAVATAVAVLALFTPFLHFFGFAFVAPPRTAVKAWYRGGQSYQENGRA